MLGALASLVGVDAKIPVVVVDNGNLKELDYNDYLEEALDAGYDVSFFHVMCESLCELPVALVVGRPQIRTGVPLPVVSLEPVVG